MGGGDCTTSTSPGFMLGLAQAKTNYVCFTFHLGKKRGMVHWIYFFPLKYYMGFKSWSIFNHFSVYLFSVHYKMFRVGKPQTRIHFYLALG